MSVLFGIYMKKTFFLKYTFFKYFLDIYLEIYIMYIIHNPYCSLWKIYPLLKKKKTQSL